MPPPTNVLNWWVDGAGTWRRFERVTVPVENFTVLNPPGAAVNAATAINASITAGNPTYLNDGNYFCAGPINSFKTNSHLRLSAGANLWRDYSSSGATDAAFLRNANTSTRISNVTIDGSGNIAATAGNGGNLMTFNSNTLTVDGIRTTYWTGGRWCCSGGNDQIWRNLTLRANPGSAQGSGGLRYMGGDNFLGENLNIISGDDVFQLVPGGAVSDPLWNIADTTNALYRNCVGRSYSARVIAVGLQDSNTGTNCTLGMNVAIKDSVFQNISGYGGGSGVNVANHSSLKTIERIHFDNVQVDQRLAGVAIADPNHGQCGETYVQREQACCGIVDSVDYSGSLFGTSGVTIYNQRSSKDLTCISNPFGGVTNVTTAHTGVGNLALDPDTLT